MKNTAELIKEKLTKQFCPDFIEIIDESDKHKDHAGAKSGGGHYRLIIKASCFENQNLIFSHRMIYKALDNLMGKQIHALSIKILKIEKPS